LITAVVGIVITTGKFKNIFKKLPKTLSLALKSEIAGILSTMVFFFWTNFGVVVTTSMYERSFSGLIQSYINALPFLRNQLIGNIIIVPLVCLAIWSFYNLSPKSNKKTMNHVE
jgi:hypothetical protein